MKSRAQTIFFSLLLLGIGLLLWSEHRQQPLSSSPTQGIIAPVKSADQFLILQKVKPGGYIGWHQTERDRMTAAQLQTRQTSNYYFVCREQHSGAQRIFLVPERTYNAERVGNVLTGGDVARFEQVAQIEEPSLPPSFDFRRREPSR